MDTPNADPAQPRKFSLGDAMLLMASLGLTLVDLKASYWLVMLPARAAKKRAVKPQMHSCSVGQ